MVLSSRKRHFIFICLESNRKRSVFFYSGPDMKNSNEEKRLDFNIDLKLDFKGHVRKKCTQKFGPYQLNNSERMPIYNSVIRSKFSYYPIIWMFCSRQTNNLINRLSEGTLRIVLYDYEINCNSLIRQNNGIWHYFRKFKHWWQKDMKWWIILLL